MEVVVLEKREKRNNDKKVKKIGEIKVMGNQ